MGKKVVAQSTMPVESVSRKSPASLLLLFDFCEYLVKQGSAFRKMMPGHLLLNEH
jgi:hypothetical protein